MQNMVKVMKESQSKTNPSAYIAYYEVCFRKQT